MREGEFIFYSGIVTEKLPVLQQITSDPHQAGNSGSTIREKAWKEEGDLVEEGSKGRREGGEGENLAKTHYNPLYKHMKLSNNKK